MYITMAVLALGFTKEEWLKIQQLKQSRNEDTHEDFTTIQVYVIVDLI
jgi:hypothetical protein